jgi:hypothetical protein
VVIALSHRYPFRHLLGVLLLRSRVQDDRELVSLLKRTDSLGGPAFALKFALLSQHAVIAREAIAWEVCTVCSLLCASFFFEFLLSLSLSRSLALTHTHTHTPAHSLIACVHLSRSLTLTHTTFPSGECPPSRLLSPSCTAHRCCGSCSAAWQWWMLFVSRPSSNRLSQNCTPVHSRHPCALS